MASKNGYFQINMTDKITYVRLFPPVEGGQPIEVDELRDYLNAKGFQLDVVLLKHAVESMKDDPIDIKLADKRCYPISESVNIKVSQDKMTAIGRFYPFSTAGPAFTLEDILNELKFHGITKGIDEKGISDFLSNKYYCTDYVLATGKKPTDGTDASIEYFFNTNPNLKPKLNDDGSVDFFTLSAISKCSSGQTLATLTKEVPGEPGYDIFGNVIPAREVKKLSLKYGRNVSLSEDGLSIISQVNGHATLVDDKVFVADVYEVSDVDTATGNIDYPGNVCVLGNVKTGYSVRAEGNVEVRGVVENALIEATGNVTIARGMNGMGKGAILAGGNVVAKFLENAKVIADGYVHAEAILQSNISAKGDVEVTGKKGFITGGIVRSEGIVSAKIIGSTMGTTTEIEVGVDPTLKIRANTLMQKIATDRKQLEQVETVLAAVSKKIKSGSALSPDQIKYFKQISSEYQNLKSELDKATNEYNDIMDEMDGTTTESYVKFQDFAYPGTKISISDVVLTLQKPTQHGRFVKDGADIRVKGY